MAMTPTDDPVKGLGPCVLCGHDPACGYSSIFHDGKEDWLCHTDGHSCYHGWTVYGLRP